MKYSQHEKFFWVKNAALLDKTYMIVESLGQLDQERQEKFSAGETPNELLVKLKEMPDKEYAKEISQTIVSHPAEIRDYCKARQSMDKARTILTCLLREEFSIDDLDKKRNEKGQISCGGFRIDEKKLALRIAKTSGSLKDYFVGLAIETARQQNDLKFLKKLVTNAESKKRPPVIDYQRISIVARFLVDYWCGVKGEYDMCGLTCLRLQKLATGVARMAFLSGKNLNPFSFCRHYAFSQMAHLPDSVRSLWGKCRATRTRLQPLLVNGLADYN